MRDFRKDRITESDKQKIQEFVSATNWTTPDWDNEVEVMSLVDILTAFNNDPKTAIEYWKNADQKAMAAMRKNYLDRLSSLGFSTDKKISNDALLAHFGGDQKAVDDFKMALRVEGQRISKQVFHDNFTVVVTQILGKKHPIH
ncbi:MAG: hypothetical protein AAFO82_10100 [Bacteroidota bacterium]